MPAYSAHGRSEEGYHDHYLRSGQDIYLQCSRDVMNIRFEYCSRLDRRWDPEKISKGPPTTKGAQKTEDFEPSMRIRAGITLESAEK